MAQVLDYSAGFPGAQAIRTAGYAGAVRYIGFPDRRKCTNAGELVDFTANGIGMALVYEDTLTDWRGGYARGQSSARRARDHANAIGFPADRPIYMAIDQDVVTATEFTTMLDYLRGASTSLGGAGLTGVYGEADVIDRARNAGAATWYWQTAAWSQGRRTAAHLFQNVGTVYVGGIGCDVNDVLSPDWGQHNEEDDVSWSEELTFYHPLTGEKATYPARDWLMWTNYFANQIPALVERINAISGELSGDEAGLIASLRTTPADNNGASAAQVDDLATRLVAALGPERASELGRRLAENQPSESA
jgi:hypothetical protein